MANFSKLLSLINGVPRTVDFSNPSNTLALAGGLDLSGNLEINGSSSGFVIINASATTATYTITMPPAQAASAGYVLTNDGTGVLSWSNPSSGSVTSVAFADDSSTPIYSVSGSPVTSSGTLAITLATQAANKVFAGPTTGSAAEPTFRSLVAADIPSLSAIYLPLSGGTLTGTLNGTNAIFSSTIAASNFSGSSSGTNTGDVSLAAVGSSPNANGASLSGQVLTLQPANASFPGVLLAADWSTFNNKLTSSLASGDIFVGNGSNVATAVAMSGQATISNTGAVTLSNAAVIAKVLTGYAAAAGTVSAADSILSAIEKVDGNDALKLPLAGGTMSGNIAMGSNNITGLSDGTYSGSALNTGMVGQVNGVAGLDSGGKVPYAQLPSALMTYKGAWDPTDVVNTLTALDASPLNGDVYRASADGIAVAGNGAVVGEQFYAGDFAIFNGTAWQRSPLADGVVSVNGASGAVTVNAINQLTSDVTAGPASGSQSVAATVVSVGGSSAANIHSAELAANAATALNTASTIVKRDSSGNFAAGTITASLTGHASLDLAKANNLSDVASASAAFANISPLTTAGDLIYENATPAPARLAIGSAGQVLTVVAGLPAWAAPAISPSAISLAQNHILVGQASGFAADVAMSGDISILASGATAIGAGKVTETQINNSALAAAGALSGGSGTKLSVNVDNSTIDISSNNLEVKAAGISATQLATGAFDQVTILGGAGTAAHVASSPASIQVMVAGESFAANTSFAVRMAVNGETAGRVYKADQDASVSDKFWVIGVAYGPGAVSAGGNINVISLGSYAKQSSDSAFASGDVGKPVYLTAAGAFSTTVPSTASYAAFKIGMVQSTTSMQIACQMMGIN